MRKNCTLVKCRLQRLDLEITILRLLLLFFKKTLILYVFGMVQESGF